jgi:hypothetical protein
MQTGTSYVVSVNAQPSNPTQTCTVTNGSGSISSSNVTNVSVTCTTNGYSIRGSTSGLKGSGLVLQNNGGDDLTIGADGAFTFAKPVSSSAAYKVTVKTPPSNPAQLCTVSGGTGTVTNADIGSVTVSCATQIVSTQSPLVAAAGNYVVESLTQVAEVAGDRLLFLSSHLAPSVTEICIAHGTDPAGSVSYVFTDNDGNSTLSPGDVVGLTFAHCYLPALAGTLDASVAATLGAAPLPVDYRTGFTATLNLVTFPLTGNQLDGPLTIVFKDSDESRVVQGTVGTGGLSIAVALAGTNDVLTVYSGTATKTIDYVAARYQVSANVDYGSATLQERYAVSTPTPLSGVFNAYPDTGLEAFQSGPSVLNYSARDASFNSQAAVWLDSAGTGISQPLDQAPWADSIKGFLWWEPRSGTVYPAATGYAVTEANSWRMRLLLADPLQFPVNLEVGDSVSPNVSIKMLFSGPVVSTQTMTFVGQSGAADVSATVTINGGFVTATPSASLAAGATYWLTTPDGTVHSTRQGPVDPFNLSMTVAP